MKTYIKRGDVVFAVGDPYRHGIVRSLHLNGGKFVAAIKWIGETSRKGDRMPVADLRPVTSETPRKPDRSATAKPRYGSYESRPARWTYHAAWQLVDGAWCEVEPVFVMLRATRLTKEAFRKTFGTLPPLPRHAFDPNRRTGLISYGCWDGLATRSRGWEAWLLHADGTWHETNAADVAFKAWVVSEQEFRRTFPDAPPLPDEAFRDGWSSPLI
jgi:hypothetical protein